MSLRRLLTRIAGIALIAASIAGLIFSIAGLILLPRIERQVEAAVTEKLDLADRTLAATADGLSAAETTLAASSQAVKSLEQTVAGIGRTVGGAVPLFDTLGEILDERLPATLETTKETLMSVARSAKLVDDILALVTSIQLLGLEGYSPDVPLHQGLAGVASSLDGIPESLSSAQESLSLTKEGLQGAEVDFAEMAKNIGSIATDLEEADSVLAQYQETVVDLQEQVSWAQQSLPQWLHTARLGLSLMLIWLGIAQIGLVTQGWELIERSRATPAESTE
jgi:hypothetical protein